ncbi:hypothetical protein Cgig2_029812 [Carnegiea gigantea]|uniref:Reverse transcriptase zinc-binding domain-containing protein n=1 Tax=Carnegiea gigantea TaxID=171969 RepID=A0A9Q1GZ17_9CARY|nr:hypothetical protein Cgig2_029812 [Carnegiea gigantea]
MEMTILELSLPEQNKESLPNIYTKSKMKRGTLWKVLIKWEEENEDYLFYACSCVQTIWNQLRQWWNQIPIVQNSNQLLRYLKQSKGLGTMKQVTSAIITAIFYHIWSAINHRIFKKQQITTCQTAHLIKDQVRSIILLLNTCSKKFNSYVDSLLN